MNERMIINSQLNDKKRAVLGGIANSKNTISDSENKILRLEEASNNLKSSISEVETLKSSILSLSIDQTKWNGKEHTTFEEAYSTYEENVKNYVSRTEDAKDAIDDDINRYKTKLDTSMIGLDNLENTLTGLDIQIAQL